MPKMVASLRPYTPLHITRYAYLVETKNSEVRLYSARTSVGMSCWWILTYRYTCIVEHKRNLFYGAVYVEFVSIVQIAGKQTSW